MGLTDPTDTRSGRDGNETEARLRTVHQLAADVPAGTDMATWALAWVLKHPSISSVIPGCKSEAQLEANVRAADLAADDHPLTGQVDGHQA